MEIKEHTTKLNPHLHIICPEGVYIQVYAKDLVKKMPLV